MKPTEAALLRALDAVKRSKAGNMKHPRILAAEVKRLTAALEQAKKKSHVCCDTNCDAFKSMRDALEAAKQNDLYRQDRIRRLVKARMDAEVECLEQARLNGMGGEREASLLAKLEAAQAKLDWYGESESVRVAEERNLREAAEAELASIRTMSDALKSDYDAERVRVVQLEAELAKPENRLAAEAFMLRERVSEWVLKCEAAEARVKELEDFAKKYCAPHSQEYAKRLEDENSELSEGLSHRADKCKENAALKAQVERMEVVIEAAKHRPEEGENANDWPLKRMYRVEEALAALSQEKP